MSYKRFINIVVSVPALIVLSVILWIGYTHLGYYMDSLHPGKTAHAIPTIFMIIYLIILGITDVVMMLASLVILAYALVAPTFFGDGLLCESFEKGDSISIDGKIVREFDENETLWHWEVPPKLSFSKKLLGRK